MLKRTCGGLFALALLIGLAPGARAQNTITSVTQPTGPGGTGATQIDNQYTNQGIYGLLDVDLDFTKVAPLSFSFDVTQAGGYTLHSDIGFNPGFTTGIVNDTGQDWTGFNFSVDTSQGAGPNLIVPNNYFSQTVLTPSSTILSDGVMPPGGTLSTIFGVLTPSAQTVTVTYTPVVAGVPEPSSLVLLGLATFCGGMAYRSHRRSRSAARSAGRRTSVRPRLELRHDHGMDIQPGHDHARPAGRRLGLQVAPSGSRWMRPRRYSGANVTRMSWIGTTSSRSGTSSFGKAWKAVVLRSL